MMTSFQDMLTSLANQVEKKRIAVAAANHEHTLEAVLTAADKGLVSPVLIGDVKAIAALLEKMRRAAKDVEMIEASDPAQAVQIAADMARGAQVDCIMKGAVDSGTLMRTLVNRDRGIRKRETMSLLAFMQSPYYHKVFAVTDVGLLTYPSLTQKAHAIQNAVEAMNKLGLTRPKVAVLAAVENVNPKMKETVEAAQLKAMAQAGELGDCVVEGPISYDLAMDPDAARLKGYVSDVSGDADLLVVPDIVAGNVLAKSLTCTGGAKTCGTVLGAMVPLVLTSRSATAEDKFMSIVLAALIGAL